MIWTHGLDELQKFITYLNSIHPKIKFTHEHSENSIDFLDTTVKIDSARKLYTTLFEKPTDNICIYIILQPITDPVTPKDHLGNSLEFVGFVPKMKTSLVMDLI